VARNPVVQFMGVRRIAGIFAPRKRGGEQERESSWRLGV
jgi:hypothetical protein